MAIELIAKIKQKNNGTFKLVDAQDVEWNGKGLDEAITSGEFKGETGAAGKDGVNATITGITASVDNTTGTPKIVATAGGTESARTFDFKFTGMKGEKGDPGTTTWAGITDKPDVALNGHTHTTANIEGLDTKLTELTSGIEALETEVGSIDKNLINDASAQVNKTYSSQKIASEITAAKQAVKDDLLGGAGAAYDTLKELGDLIETNESSIQALEALAAGHVKFDEVQTITDEQKTQARSNIGAASTTEVTTLQSTLQGEIDTVEASANKANSDLTAFKANVGDTTTDFVAAFEAALNAEDEA